MDEKLSGAELAVLTLLAEAPRHGYEIERLIAERGFREWTTIAFSSIYFLLGRLEKRGLASAPPPGEAPRSRRPFAITPEGRARLAGEALRAIAHPQRPYSDLLIGVANWPGLEHAARAGALAARADALRVEVARLEAARNAAPLPDFVVAMFDFALGQVRADLAWTEATRTTLAKLETEDGQDRPEEGL